jgi:hypothetical protein
MANAFKNTTLITKIITKWFMNNLVLAEKVDRQLDEKNIFAAKVGSTAYVRRPVEFRTTDGAEVTEGDISDIEEATVPITLDTHKKIVWAITSTQKTLNVEEITERYIKPTTKKLAQAVEDKIAGEYANIPNFEGTAGTTPSTFLNIGGVKRKLMELGVPNDTECCAFWSPNAKLNLSDGLKGVFPQKIATKAIEMASFGYYTGLQNYECQSLKLHTVGVNTGTPLVKGASQNVTYLASKDTISQSLITDGWTASQTGILKAGDVFTIADVYSVNRDTYVSTGQLQDFVVLADANSDASGNATFTIRPPIISDSTSPYQTVDSAPANDAALTVKTGTGGTAYRQNLAFHKNAITLAFARLDTPDPDEGAKAFRVDYKGISIRGIYQYNAILDRTLYRWDILFGTKAQNPSFACRITE